MEAERRSALEWKQVAVGVAAFVATPFFITGMYRVLPNIGRALWFPFFAMILLALVLWFAPAIPRSVSVGIVAATIGWAVFLAWLISQWSSPSTG